MEAILLMWRGSYFAYVAGSGVILPTGKVVQKVKENLRLHWEKTGISRGSVRVC